MKERDIYAEAGHVTCAEAREAIQRYHNACFGLDGDCPRSSIPVNPRYDDDIRLEAFIQRVERIESEIGELREKAWKYDQLCK